MNATREQARAEWWKLSLCAQFGNIRSEFSRAVKWTGRNSVQAEAALFRALELFDFTLADPKHHTEPARLREIARAREVVADHLAGPNAFNSDGPSLQKYFDTFALAERR